MTYDPFAVIREHPTWTLWTWTALPVGEQGRWYDPIQVMMLDCGLSRVGRRCTAAHEVEHALAGDTVCAGTRYDDYFMIKMEQRAKARAARKLITLDALVEALMLFEGDDEAVVDHLDVDQEALDVRRETLQPAERHYIRTQMARIEESA